jgi:hypothetical protein
MTVATRDIAVLESSLQETCLTAPLRVDADRI